VNSATPATSDVIVVGAGIGGVTAAILLGRLGVRVCLLDPYAEYPKCFKAEKIESHEAEFFERLGLLQPLLPWAGRIEEVVEARNGRVLRRLALKEFGIFYYDLVDELRRHLPDSVNLQIGRVRTVVPDPALPRVVLTNGSVLSGRLVVVASGTGGQLLSGVGATRQWIQKEQSYAFGFNVERQDRRQFDFQSVTYYPSGCDTRIAYLTFFPIQDVMRANLFVFRSASDAWVRRFIREPCPLLLDSLPRLFDITGSFRVSSKVESSRIDLFRMEGHSLPGVVAIGDAHQSVCPSTGTGLSKVITDVEILLDCAAAWLQADRVTGEQLSDFYLHPRKVTTDERSLRKARYRRQVSTDPSLRWRLHRGRVHVETVLSGWRDSLGQSAPPR
jgi:2-polyprenyl-6-methoxyphenol hydroxylase-like FAD-dependent oxidoreductase